MCPEVLRGQPNPTVRIVRDLPPRVDLESQKTFEYRRSCATQSVANLPHNVHGGRLSTGNARSWQFPTGEAQEERQRSQIIKQKTKISGRHPRDHCSRCPPSLEEEAQRRESAKVEISSISKFISITQCRSFGLGAAILNPVEKEKEAQAHRGTWTPRRWGKLSQFLTAVQYRLSE